MDSNCIFCEKQMCPYFIFNFIAKKQCNNKNNFYQQNKYSIKNYITKSLLTRDQMLTGKISKNIRVEWISVALVCAAVLRLRHHQTFAAK